MARREVGLLLMVLLAKVSALSHFYPYGVSTGDSVNPQVDDGGSPSVPIATSFAFFERAYQALFVNNNGVISFEVAVAEYTSQAFPLSDGRAFIAPFWADVDNRHKGQVLYRETTDADLLQKATEDVRAYFADFQDFAATWVFIATWDRVTYYGGSSVTSENTFQALLITNGTSSFAMFNYGDVSWTTGTASGGGNGVGGTPAQAGFNSGGSTHYFNIPGSRTADIINVEMTSNVNYPGRWIFRTDAFSVAGGCYANGKMLKYGDVYWTDGSCTTRCKCVGGETANGLECRPRPCSDSEHCVLQDGLNQCTPQETRICTVSGDPHYNTFDRVVHHFQGTCAYTLARTCPRGIREGLATTAAAAAPSTGTTGNAGTTNAAEDATTERPTELSSFHVIAKSEHRGSSTVSWTKLVQLEVYGFSLIINKGDRSRVLVNEELTSLPFTLLNGRIRASQSGSSVAISTDFGLTVTYDADHYATVTVPGAFKGRLCGVCGNYNDNEQDEFTMPNGTVTTSVTEFGNSWVQEAGCDQVILPPPACTEAMLSTYRGDSFCGLISNPNGPFAVCGTILSAFNFLESCVFDMCATGGDRDVLCQSLSAFASACQAHRATIQAWRQQINCPMTCGANTAYELCGTACPATCGDSTAPNFCTRPCTESCQCSAGLLLSGGMCVPAGTGCGCMHDGRYHHSGDTWLSDSCAARCRCDAGGRVSCVEPGCEGSERCQLLNGTLGCAAGRVGAECSAYGDPHYRSFDGLAFDFMGTCRYALASSCGATAGSLEQFAVEVENENRERLCVSWTKEVTVRAYGQEVKLLKTFTHKALVNGLYMDLPISLVAGRLQVFQSASGTLLLTEFGLEVAFDGSHVARVRVPQDYAGLTCGLCGDYNGDPRDDLRLPGGGVAGGVVEFAKAWRVAGGEVACRDDITEPCSAGGDNDGSSGPQYGSDGHCGILLRADGPFAACHSLVNVTEYFKDCVLDVGVTQGSAQVLCRALEGYVEACQAAAGTVAAWRNSTFCPKQCGANSHYEVCTSSCPESCASQGQRSRCGLPCHEGCQCDEGHVLSGGRCVPPSACGCGHGGSYHALGEAFWEDAACSRRCTCLAGGAVGCELASCGPSTVCGVHAGEVACVPQDGPPVFCQAAGDPHYYTFDGAAFDFMGTCRYTLAKTCAGGGGAVPFNVEVENDDRGSLVVSYTNLVKVDVYGHSIIIGRADYPRVRVDGVLVNLPITIIPGNLTVQTGSAALVETNFGLRVQYDGHHVATVWLPRDYRGLTCGLCGNYNGNATDDFLLPDGSLAASQNHFGQAWTVRGDGDCQATEPPSEPCPDAERPQYASGAFCGLLVEPEGPFRECHRVVRPEPHFGSCVTDVCALGGRITALCDALSAYAAACQAAGVGVSGWRNSTFCPLTCLAHSHYNACSSPCQPGCSTPQGPAAPQCGGSLCSEGCVCDDGHVLSGSACVPRSHCGCVDPASGRYLLPGESFWADDTCRRRCSCAVGGELSCQAAECGAYERCGVENGVTGCHSTGSATCRFYTDPHYVTFDGRSFDYHGTCTYVMARACGDHGEVVPPFEVLGKNDQRGGSISWPYSVSLSVYGYTITITREHVHQILVNGTVMSLNWALPSRQIWAVAQGGLAEIVTDFGLKLTYNWHNQASITVPSSLSGLTCGLCGNYNGDPTDDFALPDGTTMTSANEFAGSWRAEAVAEDQGCLGGGGAPPPPPLPVCLAADRDRYGSGAFCGIIADPTGPLRGCHAAANPGTYFDSCVSDVCLYGGRRDILCQALEAYVVVCQAANGTVDAWRNDSFCPMSCQSNSHYELCGNTCQRSCSDLAQQTICSRGPCAEGCRCNPGTVWRSGRCVPLAECGCFHGGQNYASGEAFWPDELCRERCECRRDGSVACEATGGCGVGESCGVLAGARGCHPAGRASCRAWSDPHYVTFDGLAFDFQGACTYTLARNCSRELPQFEVRARNGNLGSSAVSVPRQVTVAVYGQQVDIFAGDGANVQVNGLNRNLPVSHDNGRLSVYRSGSSTVVSTDFGLQVSYNHRYHVTVEVASTFQSKLCGLCGNYNLNATDEFLSPEGRPVADPVQFGISWRVNDGSVCNDGSGAPPVCDPEQRALYGSDGYCGILTSPDGPFAGCHATVSPDSYYDSCVFDLCAMGGGADLLAGALEAYTGACQSDGGTVEEWRNDTLGQHSCPLHSHYELCGSACPSSCAELAGPAGCHRPCGEGCQCDRGYVWSGAECVSVAQCGCDYNGRYLQAGEAVWSDGCSERCECSTGGLVRCSPASCPVGLSCSVRAGARGCFQAAAARCTVTNDPHYFTFDGAVVHYQGVCAYDVARPCGGSGGGEPYPFFRVVMENKRRGTAAVSFISGVHLIVGSAHVLLRGREVLVNGARTLLPVVVAEGVALSEEGSGFVVARTPHNVTVRYDWLYTAHVEVGAEYAGRLCGMCGNYNGDPRDDLLTPSGEIAMDARQFGRSWRAPDVDAGCEDTMDHVEPGRCDEEEMRGHCFVLSDPEGPFRSCHWFVDPALYLESCVYDLCSYEATKLQLCRALEAYSQACGLAGVPLGDWKGSSGCPASDPCSAISCGEREWCGSNSGIYGCYCDENSQGPSVNYTLSCEATEMNIALSSCQLFHKGFTVQYLHLNSPACRGNDTGGQVYFSTIISTSDHCGSQVTTNATHIIYTNAVRGVVDPSTNPAITQQKKITIEFGCAYPIENNASSTPVLPTINNTEITIPTQPGKFLLQMRLYKSDAFTSVYESTVSLGTDEFLYVGITLTGGDPARFKQQIRDCWATPTADPNHPVQFIFVTNSCPATQDASVKIIENGVSQFSKFSMKVFKFVGNYNQVHLHCRVAVCDSQSTVCTKRCSLRNAVPDSEKDTKIMTLGPLERKEEKPSTSEGQNSAASKPAYQAAALLLPLAFAASVLM
ncbi:IgGFc-binding protein-like [Lampetra planeri]